MYIILTQTQKLSNTFFSSFWTATNWRCNGSTQPDSRALVPKRTQIFLQKMEADRFGNAKCFARKILCSNLSLICSKSLLPALCRSNFQQISNVTTNCWKYKNHSEYSISWWIAYSESSLYLTETHWICLILLISGVLVTIQLADSNARFNVRNPIALVVFQLLDY